jgi:inhibitor of cysteine peptidase
VQKDLEKEVKRKTAAYGTAALLIALMLAAFAYNFGVQPFLPLTFSPFKNFTSQSDMEDFIKDNMDKAQTYASDPQLTNFRATQTAEENTLSGDTKAAPEYSTTNIQVEGVDEADIVKTDGKYLYVVSGNTIYIINADPYSDSPIQKITLNETYNIEIYINANKLAILGNRYQNPDYRTMATTVAIYPYVYTEEVIIKVYDLTNIANPTLTRDITVNGTLAGSRMIGNYIYASIVQPAIRPIVYPVPEPVTNETQLDIMLPQITTDGITREVQPTEIKYIEVADVSYYFTTILAVNIQNDAQPPTYETFLAGTDSKMYVSQNNMYLTVANMNWWVTRTDTAEPREETLIYRIKLDQERIIFEAHGAVPGYLLNQFSMDEYNDHFRVATTIGWGDVSTNNLYVLNMSLTTVGKLEGLASGERIYSARFMGNRVYLVTFRQVDPFFVIDLTNPTTPEVLGYLKIPGFSGYLHPYDENYVIGVGKQDSNVKISLYDVTDVTAPIEAIPPYIIKASYSDTSVLYDHKAFLFSKSKQLLALPISINEATWIDDAYYSKGYWQGEYVFTISLTNGFTLKGNITHQETTAEQWDNSYWIKRALYINNVLYTMSDKKVKMNNLADISLLKEVLLS